jgi:hypothetical protein
MTNRVLAYTVSVLTITIAISVVTALAQGPVGVSPGAVDRAAEVEGRCPTFIWGVVPDAQAYELVVYRLPDEPQASGTAGVDLSASNQVLYSRVPGGATAWQPGLADGLEPGGTYVWFVRAVLREETEEIAQADDWSEARFFSIPAAPSLMEVEDALDVLRRYTGMSDAQVDGFDQPQSEARSTGSDRTAPHRRSATPPESLKSVPTATAAIKGTIPDPAGETYGVVGISNSPGGAGVAAANTAGGPDLVLDGSEDYLPDAEFSESGIDRPSASPQTFSLSNSGGGGMTLDINGVEVVTTATDRDTVGELSCGSGQLAKWNGAGWVCAPDLDTDTLAGLSCTASQVAKWTGSNWQCQEDQDALGILGCGAGQIAKHDGSNWICAADEQASFAAGPGIVIDGGEIRIDLSAFSTRISTLDRGRYTSIAIGADDLGLISYYGIPNLDLKVAHCTDTACSTATTTALDTEGNVGRDTSIAIGADGFGLVSYYDLTNFDLKVAHCEDTACSTAATVALDSTGDVGTYTSIVIGTDGFGLISYYDVSSGDLKVAHCNDTACSTATKTALDTEGNVGKFSSITIGADGLGLISYMDVTNLDLKVAHCADTACSSATTAILVSSSDVGAHTSIAIGPDGFGLISFFDLTAYSLRTAHCTNTTCSSGNASDYLDIVGAIGYPTSIAIAEDGLGLISYLDSTDNSLKVAHCDNTTCSILNTTTLDTAFEGFEYTSIAIGADGRGLVSYNESSTSDIKVAHLGIDVL